MQFQPEFLSISITLDLRAHTDVGVGDIISDNMLAAVKDAGFCMHDEKFQESERGTVNFDLIVRPDRCDVEGCDCGSPRGERYVSAQDVVDLTHSIGNVEEVTSFEVSATSKLLEADRRGNRVKVDERHWEDFKGLNIVLLEDDEDNEKKKLLLN